jgi:hypothetical protein
MFIKPGRRGGDGAHDANSKAVATDATRLGQTTKRDECAAPGNLIAPAPTSAAYDDFVVGDIYEHRQAHHHGSRQRGSRC